MFRIDGFDISLTRGDTATLVLSFEGDAPGEQDRVLAALKKNAGKAREDAIWEKELAREPDGTYALSLESGDTLALPFGRYAWDIRILYEDGQITTPFAPAAFEIVPVVTDLPQG